MRARAIASALLALLAVVVLEGCEAPPANPKKEKVTVTRELLHAFRDAVHAHYELRLLADPENAFKEKAEKELEPAKESEKQARKRLVQALADAGSLEAKKSDKLADLIPILRDALVRGRDYAFIVPPDSEEASFALVRLAREPEEHELTVFGEKWTYVVHAHDETLIPDYSMYRAAKLAPAGSPVLRPAVTLGRNVYLDLAAARWIGRQLFFPRVGALKAAATAAMAGDGPFEAQARNPGALLMVAKDVLRWRSLEGFWATVQAKPAEEQQKRFAEEYAAHEEVRAACEAFEIEKARAAGVERPSGDALLALEKRTYLDAIIHDEPLGHVATVVGLAGELAANEKARLDPGREARLKAAVSVTIALVKTLAGEKKGAASDPAEDAKDVARLARATPAQLQAAARAVYEQLFGKLPG